MDLASPMASAVYLYRINYRFKHQSRGAAYTGRDGTPPHPDTKAGKKHYFFRLLDDLRGGSCSPNRLRLKGTAPEPATISTSSNCNGLPRADSNAGTSTGRPLLRSLKTTDGPSGFASQSSPHFLSAR